MSSPANKRIVLLRHGPEPVVSFYDIDSSADLELGQIIRDSMRDEGLPLGSFKLDVATLALVDRILQPDPPAIPARLVEERGQNTGEAFTSAELICAKNAPIGTVVTNLVAVLLRTIPPILVLAAMSLALTASDQGQDILRGIEGSPGKAATLCGSVLFLVSLTMALLPDFVWPREGASAERDLLIHREMPKMRGLTALWTISMLLGLLVGFLIVGLAIGRDDGETWAIFPRLLGGAFAAALTAGLLTAVMSTLFSRRLFQRDGLRAGIGLAIILAIAFHPAELGEILTTAPILALALAGWMLLAADISRLRHRWDIGGETIIAALLVIALIGGLRWHAPLDRIGSDKSPVAKLPLLTSALTAQLKGQVGGQPTVVIVAAAGGGIRASYWTAKVLARITDRAPVFRRQLFLASGVSGGSLGLALYRALLATPGAACVAADRIEPCVAPFHQRDHLAGILAASVTGEALNLLWRVLPQRGHALEETWEARWREVAGNSDRFADPFTALSLTEGPALVLNTTAVTDGNRLPVANLATTDWLALDARCRTNIAAEVDLSLSAAANASARFPFLEEWGRFPVHDPKATGCKPFEAVADGGFNDNYGAATALDALRAVVKLPDVMTAKPRIIVIQIVSDPDCPAPSFLGAPQLAAECQQRLKERMAELTFRKVKRDLWTWLNPYADPDYRHNTLMPMRRIARPLPSDGTPGPVDVAMRARALGGAAVAEALRREACMGGGSYYLFSLAGAFDAPLGWAMSTPAQASIDQLLATGANARTLDQLIEKLNAVKDGNGSLHGNCAKAPS